MPIYQDSSSGSANATKAYTATEALAKGDILEVWNDAGTAKVRKALQGSLITGFAETPQAGFTNNVGRSIVSLEDTENAYIVSSYNGSNATIKKMALNANGVSTQVWSINQAIVGANTFTLARAGLTGNWIVAITFGSGFFQAVPYRISDGFQGTIVNLTGTVTSYATAATKTNPGHFVVQWWNGTGYQFTTVQIDNTTANLISQSNQQFLAQSTNYGGLSNVTYLGTNGTNDYFVTILPNVGGTLYPHYINSSPVNTATSSFVVANSSGFTMNPPASIARVGISGTKLYYAFTANTSQIVLSSFVPTGTVFTHNALTTISGNYNQSLISRREAIGNNKFVTYEMATSSPNVQNINFKEWQINIGTNLATQVGSTLNFSSTNAWTTANNRQYNSYNAAFSNNQCVFSSVSDAGATGEQLFGQITAGTINLNPVGLAKNAIASLATGDVSLNGDIITGLTGLTVGAKYYMNLTTGALQTAVTSVPVGFALSATELQVRMNP